MADLGVEATPPLRRQISYEATQSNWGDLVIMEFSRLLFFLRQFGEPVRRGQGGPISLLDSGQWPRAPVARRLRKGAAKRASFPFALALPPLWRRPKPAIAFTLKLPHSRIEVGEEIVKELEGWADSRSAAGESDDILGRGKLAVDEVIPPPFHPRSRPRPKPPVSLIPRAIRFGRVRVFSSRAKMSTSSSSARSPGRFGNAVESGERIGPAASIMVGFVAFMQQTKESRFQGDFETKFLLSHGAICVF